MNIEYVKDIIAQAIESKKPIKLTYDNPSDSAKGLRIGNPHALYYAKSTNKTKVDVYQTSGDSSNRTSIPGWKPFDINFIKTIEIINNQSFNVQEKYDANSSRYIDCIIKIE